MRQTFQKQLTLFAEGHPANLYPLPGSEEARMTTVGSGQKCIASYKNAIPDGRFLKMFLESSIWASTRCFLTWKVKATKQQRLYFQLAPSMPRIEGIECGLLPTMEANERNAYPRWTKTRKHGQSSEPNLAGVILNQHARMLLPTPVAQDGKNGNLPPSQITRDTLPEQILRDSQQQSGSLNPEFVREMMGFPKGWLD